MLQIPFFVPSPSSAVTLANKTLIVPIVSAANISQLATDLLISSLNLRHLGTFNPTYLIPVVGGRDDGEPGISTPLELFGRSEMPWVVMQQRSPVLKGRSGDFITDLFQFIEKSKFAGVLFLSGVNLSERTDAQMKTPTYYLLPPHSSALEAGPLNMSKLSIPPYTSQQTESVPYIPGGGITRQLISAIPSTWSIPTATLLQFVMEGDNRNDARLFASIVADVVAATGSIKEWRTPNSWRLGLFGPPHDGTLYG